MQLPYSSYYISHLTVPITRAVLRFHWVPRGLGLRLPVHRSEWSHSLGLSWLSPAFRTLQTSPSAVPLWCPPSGFAHKEPSPKIVPNTKNHISLPCEIQHPITAIDVIIQPVSFLSTKNLICARHIHSFILKFIQHPWKKIPQNAPDSKVSKKVSFKFGEEGLR